MRTAFLGHFGSGKTEVAIGYALELAGAGSRPLLLDLDVVTPYFRSRDHRRRLAELGVEVVAPEEEWSAADLPIIAAAALAHLRQGGDRPVVLDVGGDAGAQLLATLGDLLARDSYRVLAVINTCRPATATAAQVAGMVRWLETMARTRVDGLVNNTNLGAETTAATALAGLTAVEEAAGQLGVPVAFTACPAEHGAAFRAAGVEVLPLRLFMRPPWQELP